MKRVIFIDTEVSENDSKVHDFGAVDINERKLHTGSSQEFHAFISDTEFLCGHNIVEHDAKYIELPQNIKLIDTLYLSPLMFPNKPYHALLKDDKLLTDELNNPLNDAIKAMQLYYDEINAFTELDDTLKMIYHALLYQDAHFSGFFDFMDYQKNDDAETAIRLFFDGELCENAPLSDIIQNSPVELAYCLALISATEPHSLIPRWVQINYPKVDTIMQILRNTSCGECGYCLERLTPTKYLSKYFGYPSFRTYNGEPLQENAVNAAVAHQSLLAIFPTGGGKSLTFQIPALMAGETERALTVVISPLQSLMKDQVDNLEKRGIAEAVTINGLLSPIERAEAIDRVESGIASILYISPESLRSVTIERLLLSRHIDRFVIDEAHCFSAWGQDFRVDYLYIGDFIRELQEKKGHNCHIPVSCFTATAKQKVISDIKDYFKNKLDLDLQLFATNASRTNLHYVVLYKETDAEKYDALRNLIEQKNCPTIVYVSRTKRTRQIAEKLCNDGFKARPFNGKMESSEKQENQEAFINDEVQIIVATSAFGMGVDKSNVKLVIHYDISDSLENYVQEAGRAGRDQSLQAECYVLFNDGDLDKHFMLLNQTKLSISEIQQVWKAVKDLTKIRPEICCSPLEVARQAGWDDSVSDIETRVRTALQALENAGYLKRGKNVPRIYGTSILVKSMMEATAIIDESFRFEDEKDRTTAKRIMKSLISSKSIAEAGNDEAESRIDYLADRLGLEKSDVIHSIQQMREDGIIADSKDLTAYIKKNDSENKSLSILHKYQALEQFLLTVLSDDNLTMNYKELNEKAQASGVKSSTVNAIKTIFYYWTIRSLIQKEQDSATNRVTIVPQVALSQLSEKRQKSCQIAEFIIHYLYENSGSDFQRKDEVLVGFSVLELMNAYKSSWLTADDCKAEDIEEALLFLQKINAIKLEGGFLVLYSGMRLQRLIMDNKIRYKMEDYRQLNEFYQQKVQQIHIVGEYANMMVRSYDDALQFVNDYFQMDYKQFISQYFSGERAAEIERNITPEKYRQLFDTLSPRQLEIINDHTSQNIVVAAGPGSGKTKVLVHKLAALLLLEDVKHEQLLMLTFSRAAATEFKSRLMELIGNAAHFVEIKTFHSYCFDLLGKIGSLDNAENVVREAGELIRNGDVDFTRITKSVLVIDEAQDMDCHEYALVEALMKRNDGLRVIAVGDDDQNIYEFRGSNSKYLKYLISMHDAKLYSLIDNYRSDESIVAFSNLFVKQIHNRMKTEDICAFHKEAGYVKLVKHLGEHMETALVNDLVSESDGGSTCVLTQTNQEALWVLGMLRQRGIPAKLVQSLDSFQVYHIAEIRHFLRCLERSNVSPIISDSDWNTAIEEMQKRYENSVCLPVVLRILNTFSAINEKKYRTDLEMFLLESKIEDFEQNENGIISISTIHKSKGREYDNVYMLLNTPQVNSNEKLRGLYVGITRAKHSLHIHYTGTAFDIFFSSVSAYETDNTRYAKPTELILQLSHRDVFLSYFKGKKELIGRLVSGTHLQMQDKQLLLKVSNRTLPVLRFSQKCNTEIQRLIGNGYLPYDAVVRFVCAWKGQDDTEETAIILPEVYFRLKDDAK